MTWYRGDDLGVNLLHICAIKSMQPCSRLAVYQSCHLQEAGQMHSSNSSPFCSSSSHIASMLTLRACKQKPCRIFGHATASATLAWVYSIYLHACHTGSQTYTLAAVTGCCCHHRSQVPLSADLLERTMHTQNHVDYSHGPIHKQRCTYPAALDI